MTTFREFPIVVVVLALATAGTVGCSKEESPAPVRSTEVDVEKLAKEAREAQAEPAEPQAPVEGEKAAPEQQAPPKPSKWSVGPQLPGSIGYLPTVMGAYSSSKVKLAVAELTANIQNFYGLEGRYPESLEELAEWRGRPLPVLGGRMSYDYDPQTGQLKVTEAKQ